jgi:hypothetical protein
LIYTSILGYTEFFFYFVLLYITFLLHRITRSFAWSYTEFFSSVLLCDNFLLHRVTRSFARSYTEFFFPSCYFVIIFVTQSFTEFCTEFHRVLHGVTQSFFPSCYFVIIFCYTDHRRVLLFPLCYSVSTLWYSVKLFFYCTQSLRALFSSVLLCEYSVVLCETFFLLHIVSQSIFSPLCYSVSTLWHSVKLNF